MFDEQAYWISISAGDAQNKDWKYLLSYGNDMLRGSLLQMDEKRVHLSISSKKVIAGLRKDLIIDRPPRKGLLRPNYEVLMPLSHAFDKNNKFQSYCGRSKAATDYFIKAAVVTSDGESYLVKAVYVRK